MEEERVVAGRRYDHRASVEQQGDGLLHRLIQQLQQGGVLFRRARVIAGIILEPDVPETVRRVVRWDQQIEAHVHYHAVPALRQRQTLAERAEQTVGAAQPLLVQDVQQVQLGRGGDAGDDTGHKEPVIRVGIGEARRDRR